jgi:hypothetical protein
VITALKAMTIWPAYQHFEEKTGKGSLEPGKLADLAILSEDPTAVDPETLATIKVTETIKEGETIYAAGEREGRLDYRPLAGRCRPLCRLPARARREPRHGRHVGQGDSVAGLRLLTAFGRLRDLGARARLRRMHNSLTRS